MIDDSNKSARPLNGNTIPIKGNSLLRDLSGTYSTTDSNHMRVDLYTKIYKRIRPKSSKTYRKSTARTASNDNDSENAPSLLLTQIRPSTRSTSRISHKPPGLPKAGQLVTHMKSLLYDFHKLMSDKSELIRDLATYENNFAKENELFVMLERLRLNAVSLPEQEKLTQEQFMDNKVLEKLNKGLSSIVSLERENLKTDETSVENEEFYVRKSLQFQKLDIVYQGIFIISSVSTLINIRSDKWLEHLEISAHPINGPALQLNLRLSISNTYQNQKQIFRIITKKILPHLYYKYIDNSMCIFYDERHGSTFYSIICKIKGLGQCSVEITENENEVRIEPSIIDHALEVPRSVITHEPTVFKVKPSHIAYLISKYMCYVHLNRSLFWIEGDNQDFIYLEKESQSKLMNDEYLKEMLDNTNFITLYKIEFCKDGKVFKLSVIGTNHIVKLKAEWGSESVDIPKDSKYFNYLVQLQSFNIRKGFSTVKNSLELEYFFMKVFPRAFRQTGWRFFLTKFVK
ncbi:unnamed protein product [Blepharisma stoltei]|uniref:Uncharacterized protein n=1 Tax=Blepharisma stoltei TaxID=1481888 RepID=A0AAU9IHH0_9CILI|nr:unnamed protein product [Blepharisma stoltei]